MRYNKGVIQRNDSEGSLPVEVTLMRNHSRCGIPQLAMLGERIFTRRKEFISELLPVFRRYYYEFISQGKEKIDLITDPSYWW